MANQTVSRVSGDPVVITTATRKLPCFCFPLLSPYWPSWRTGVAWQGLMPTSQRSRHGGQKDAVMRALRFFWNNAICVYVRVTSMKFYDMIIQILYIYILQYILYIHVVYIYMLFVFFTIRFNVFFCWSQVQDLRQTSELLPSGPGLLVVWSLQNM